MRYLCPVVLFVVLGLAVPVALAFESRDWLDECIGGLNDTDNTSVNALASFNGVLYAGISSVTDKAEVPFDVEEFVLGGDNAAGFFTAVLQSV